MALDKSARDLAHKVLSNPDLYPDEFKSWLTTYLSRAANLKFPKTSLTGIAGENWHNVGDTGEPAFGSGWRSYGAGATVWGKVRFYKDYLGIVHLDGLIESTLAVPATTMFTLPPGYRPAQEYMSVHNAYSVALGGYAAGRVDLDPGGAVVLQNPTAAQMNTSSWWPFHGITFRAA